VAEEQWRSPTTVGSDLGHGLLARLIQRHRLLHDSTGTDGDGGGSTFLFLKFDFFGDGPFKKLTP
jgi:hypothetical protein